MAHGDGNDVFADDFDALCRNAHAEEAAVSFGPDFGGRRDRPFHEADRSPADVDDARRGLKRFAARLADLDLERALEAVRSDDRTRRRALQPLRDRFEGRPERVGQKDGVVRHRLLVVTCLPALGEHGVRLRSRDGGPPGECLATEGGVERELDRLPVGCVADTNLAGHQVDRRFDDAEARDRPSIRGPGDRDFFAANRRGAEVDHERRGCAGPAGSAGCWAAAAACTRSTARIARAARLQ